MSSVQSSPGTMQLTLSTEEAAHLREALSAYLSQLQKEAAHTDDKAFRDHLWERERLLQNILTQLASP